MIKLNLIVAILLNVSCSSELFSIDTGKHSSQIIKNQTSRISGYIIDKETKETLPGVSVNLENTNIGASTDIDGFFSIDNIPAGRYKILIYYSGFHEYYISNVIITTESYGIRYSIEIVEKYIQPIIQCLHCYGKSFIWRGKSHPIDIRDYYDIKHMPIRNIQDIAAGMAGIVR